ncbi:MAG: ribonuclease R [Pseudomonadota bacterium]
MSKKKRTPASNAGTGNSTGRSAKRYQHKVPDRNAVNGFLKSEGRPVDFDTLSAHFELTTRKQKIALAEVLTKMLGGGQILLNRNEEYCLTDKLNLVRGTVSAHKDGFGFLMPDDGSEDMYLSPRRMQTLMHGDRVAGRIVNRSGRGVEGKVIEILERAVTEVAGRYVRERGIGLVVPDNPKLTQHILVPSRERGSAKPGEMVVAEILDYPTQEHQATARIVKVLGAPDQNGMPTDLAIHAHNIPHQWPAAVTAEAKVFGKTVPTRAKKDRVDLRDLPLVTIDGADARDFDDAVYATPRKDGWRLIVAIADVAHYVRPGSAIDTEALKRATSVYFPDRVVPMLPEVLSNGLCSLNPKVDRLCMVCDMSVSASGEVLRAKFYDAVMRSAARLTYSEVAGHLSGERALESITGPINDSLLALHALYKKFAQRRKRRGAIELDLPQLRIGVNADGDVERINSLPRNDAHRLIEECMIAANVEAARFITRRKVQALFRVHAKPDEERFNEFRLFMTDLGFKVPHAAHPKPSELRKLMASAQDRPDSFAINMALLRSFAHAEYTPDNIGHFGLALDQYAHFTSPIRRYPDLLVHRAIRHMTSGGKARQHIYDAPRMLQLGKLTSERERRAEEATREVEALLKCQYMSKHLGERFEGLVTGVTHFGLFVQIGELMVDGLVHVSTLRNDYYEHQPERQRLVGSRSGQIYALGDSVEIIVERVDLESRQIDFVLYDHKPNGKADGKPNAKRNGKSKRQSGQNGDAAGGSRKRDPSGQSERRRRR